MDRTSELRAVLLLDGDPCSGLMLKGIFSSVGWEVVEARTGSDADQALKEHDFLLVIVDYRLTDSDGVNWIARMRETGNRIPIVYLSPTLSDPETFTYLHEKLQVSLTLLSPIVPELFLEQIRAIMPIAAPRNGYIVEELPNMQNIDRKQEGDNQFLNQMLKFRQKLEVERAIEIACSEYAKMLPTRVKELILTIEQFKSEPSNTTKH